MLKPGSPTHCNRQERTVCYTGIAQNLLGLGGFTDVKCIGESKGQILGQTYPKGPEVLNWDDFGVFALACYVTLC
jgi:hypothetical protein